MKFTVPGAARAATTPGSEIPASIPMGYKIMKKGRALPGFAPVSISDDGRKTTFVIPPGAPMPTIFRADAKGQEYSVNAAVRGTTITVSTRGLNAGCCVMATIMSASRLMRGQANERGRSGRQARRTHRAYETHGSSQAPPPDRHKPLRPLCRHGRGCVGVGPGSCSPHSTPLPRHLHLRQLL